MKPNYEMEDENESGQAVPSYGLAVTCLETLTMVSQNHEDQNTR